MHVGFRFLPLVSLLSFGCDRAAPPTTVPGAPPPLACRSSVDPEQLIPRDAVVVGHYDMARERRFAPDVPVSQAGGPRSILPAKELEAVRLAWIGLAAACDLDDGFLGEAWVAIEREDGLVVVTGEGIGSGEDLRCLQRQLGRWKEDVLESTIVDDGCGVSFEYEGLLAFAPHDDLLVFGTKGAAERARRAWSTGVVEGASTLMPERRSGKRYMWAAVDVSAFLTPDELAQGLAAADVENLDPLAAVRSVEIEAELGRRYSLRVGSAFRAESDARAVEAIMQAWIDAPPPWLPDWGVGLVRELELRRDGTRVDLELPLTHREAHRLGLLPSDAEAQQAPGFPWLGLAAVLL